MDKYTFSGETLTFRGHTLRRIRALQNILTLTGIVYKGELGGFVEKKRNLSQEGSCWIGDDAKVMDNAIVKDNAIIDNWGSVMDEAIISENASIHGYAVILNSAQVRGATIVRDDAVVRDFAIVKENVFISANAVIGSNVIMEGDADISENGFISEVSDYICLGGEGGIATIYKTFEGISVMTYNQEVYTVEEYKEMFDPEEITLEEINILEDRINGMERSKIK